jgi:hypothetical protein
MLRFNLDKFHDDNPQDAVGGTNVPSVARVYSRQSFVGQVNHTWVVTPALINEARFAYLDGDPVTRWDAQVLSTAYTRAGSVPFTIGQSRLSNLFGHQAQFSDTLSWAHGKHYLRAGGSIVRHTSGGFGSEPGTAVLGTFTFLNTTTAPFGQLTLADVQNYTQPINFGISTYNLTQWLLAGFVQDSIHLRRDLTVDVGLRYDRQTLTDATKDFAPRVGFGWHPRGDARLSVRGGYSMYYTQIQSNLTASYLVGGLDGLTTYTATPGQLGFPTCLVGSCLPLVFDPKTLPPSELPARDITIQAGRRSFYEAQFAKYGLNFDKLPYYPDKLVNPRSQVATIGLEREIVQGYRLRLVIAETAACMLPSVTHCPKPPTQLNRMGTVSGPTEATSWNWGNRNGDQACWTSGIERSSPSITISPCTSPRVRCRSLPRRAPSTRRPAWITTATV